jgi:tetratricopeptide (TPR) repeat protein
MGRATIVSVLVLLATAPAVAPPDAARDIEEAVQIAQEIESHPDEAWALWSLGLLNTVYGRFGCALDAMQRGLRTASEIGHREWAVGNRFALGVLYAELLAPEEARRQLEEALTLTKELRSQYWVHHVTGALAGACYLLNDLTGALTCLDTVISPQTPMDTMGKRYCWARRAELALSQGDPALALEITERLIASAPGISPGRVITFLWKLKGEALAALGCAEEACSLLRAALENVQVTEERFLLWRIHASLRRLYCATDHHEEDEKEFSAASELIQAMAITVPDEALKGNFCRRAHRALRTSP